MAASSPRRIPNEREIEKETAYEPEICSDSGAGIGRPAIDSSLVADGNRDRIRE